MRKEKLVINNNEFRDIIICIMWPSTINYASGMLAREVGRDMWISGIIGVLTILPFVLLIIYIGQKFPNKTIIEYSEELLGPVLGKLLGGILAIYFFVTAASSISMYIHHLSDFLLTGTPFLVIITMHVLVICYLVWKGPEVIARVGVIAFKAAIIFYLMVFAASLSEINIGRIKPFFDSGVVNVFKASLQVDTFIGLSPLVVPMLLPMVHDKKSIFGAATSGLLIGGLFFIFYFIVELMVMGPQVVALMRIASMDFVRSIQITKYLHRFESFMVALWYWSIMIQAGVLSSCSLEAFAQTTKIKKRKLLIIVFGLIMIVAAYYMASNRVFFLNLREHIWKYFSLPINFGIPLVITLALGIRRIRNYKRQK